MRRIGTLQQPASEPLANSLSKRNLDVFRRLVETYLIKGNPVGSRTLSREMSGSLSPSTIRNVMQDLEFLGVLQSPHVSAGRIPTDVGLRLFVDELLEFGEISEDDREILESVRSDPNESLGLLMDRIGSVLSSLTHSASIVLIPKQDAAVKHVEFISLAPDRALVVLVTTDGNVENRIFSPPAGQTPADMQAAANFVNSISRGRTISELLELMKEELDLRRMELDRLTSELITRGLAVWDGEGNLSGRLVVRGRSKLLDEKERQIDIEMVQRLFDDLERKQDIIDFLHLVQEGTGVRIFIGSENKLFSLSGSTLVAAPYIDSDNSIIGAVGVIGPTRLNYGRIVPIVDYTAHVAGRVVSQRNR
ncbi:MAG: heat-inducible transcriptional repressor HrcA [Rhodobacteraceae bacterium]|nr:heat-inducible transcriptional repressor HrcA [Paracoccaceae bacterium]